MRYCGVRTVTLGAKDDEQTAVRFFVDRQTGHPGYGILHCPVVIENVERDPATPCGRRGC